MYISYFTIRHAREISMMKDIAMICGLPDYSEDEAFLERVQAEPIIPLPPERLLSYVYDEPLRFAPGSRYQYSNSDNIAVGLMVEAATRRSYEHELHAQVFGPLNLTQTSLPVGARLPRPYIHGYAIQPPEPPEDVSKVLSSSFAWALGGMVSTPAELNSFVRGYMGGRLFGSDTQAEQLQFVEGGSSEPPGPGANAAGLGIFRYETSCGVVYGHTGNYPGYTQFMAATGDGRRSMTVSVNEQLRPDIAPEVFAALLDAEGLAVCAALASDE
jgi:D-alanyl-D-alanine carboxypeptidase